MQDQKWIPSTFGDWTIMPNYNHGIVIIVDINTSLVETLHATSLPSERMFIGRDQGVFTISKRVRRVGTTAFTWQSRFYDHIFRNKDARSYIWNSCDCGTGDQRIDVACNVYTIGTGVQL